MPTGDPYCPFHGYSPCGCQTAGILTVPRARKDVAWFEVPIPEVPRRKPNIAPAIEEGRRRKVPPRWWSR